MTSKNLINELKVLQKSMDDYVIYLKDYTYGPYEQIYKFSKTLKQLIENYES